MPSLILFCLTTENLTQSQFTSKQDATEKGHDFRAVVALVAGVLEAVAAVVLEAAVVVEAVAVVVVSHGSYKR